METRLSIKSFAGVMVLLFLTAMAAGCTSSTSTHQQSSNPAAPSTSATTASKTQEPSSVARIAENYIAKYFAPEGEEVRVTSIWEEHGVYGFNVTVMGMNYTSYITKDGKIIFPTGFYTDRAPPAPEAAPPEAMPPEETLPSEMPGQ